MPIPIPEAIAESAELAQAKAANVTRPPRFLVSAMLAGAYIGIGIIVLAACAGPFLAANSPAAKLVSGAVFGIALTLCVMAGAELFTGNVMVMLQGLIAGSVSAVELSLVWVATLVGNLGGSLLLAWMVDKGGTLYAKTATGAPGPAGALIDARWRSAGGLQRHCRPVEGDGGDRGDGRVGPGRQRPPGADRRSPLRSHAASQPGPRADR